MDDDDRLLAYEASEHLVDRLRADDPPDLGYGLRDGSVAAARQRFRTRVEALSPEC